MSRRTKINKAEDKSTELLINTIKANTDFFSRANLTAITRGSHNGDRDLYDVFGYPTTIMLEDYTGRYLRQDIAKRIISAFPEATWKTAPEVLDKANRDEGSPFEEAFETLADNINLYNYLKRADKLAGLGRYSVLYIGTKDGGALDEPLKGKLKPESILYLAPYSELNAKIQDWEKDPTNPRYGKPTLYLLTTAGFQSNSGTAIPVTPLTVHWTRCIHIAEDVLENDLFGQPRMEAVFNRLMDLEKVVGGSAEIFWLNGRGGMALDVDKDAIFDDTAKTSLQASVTDYVNKLTRILKTKGVKTQILEHSIPDPTGVMDALIKLISGTIGIPARILVGSERGELASSQDETAWVQRILERQQTYAGPMVLKQVVDWFIKNGILPPPENNTYKIQWEPESGLSALVKSQIALNKSTALGNYVNAQGADTVMSPQQFVEDILEEEYREEDLQDAIALDQAQQQAQMEAMTQKGQPNAQKA